MRFSSSHLLCDAYISPTLETEHSDFLWPTTTSKKGGRSGRKSAAVKNKTFSILNFLIYINLFYFHQKLCFIPLKQFFSYASSVRRSWRVHDSVQFGVLPEYIYILTRIHNGALYFKPFSDDFVNIFFLVFSYIYMYFYVSFLSVVCLTQKSCVSNFGAKRSVVADGMFLGHDMSVFGHIAQNTFLWCHSAQQVFSCTSSRHIYFHTRSVRHLDQACYFYIIFLLVYTFMFYVVHNSINNNKPDVSK